MISGNMNLGSLNCILMGIRFSQIQELNFILFNVK